MEVPERRGGSSSSPLMVLKTTATSLRCDDQDALADDAEKQAEDQADAGQ